MLTSELYSCFIASFDMQTFEDAFAHKIRNIFTHLPDSNKIILQYLLDFLWEVSTHTKYSTSINYPNFSYFFFFFAATKWMCRISRESLGLSFSDHSYHLSLSLFPLPLSFCQYLSLSVYLSLSLSLFLSLILFLSSSLSLSSFSSYCFRISSC